MASQLLSFVSFQGRSKFSGREVSLVFEKYSTISSLLINLKFDK